MVLEFERRRDLNVFMEVYSFFLFFNLLSRPELFIHLNE